MAARKKRLPRQYHRNRGFALDEIDRLSDPLFKRMFRIDRDTFNELVQMIEDHRRSTAARMRTRSASEVSAITRLAVTLRWLAGASYIDLCFAWGVSKATFFSDRGVLWPTIEMLDDVLQLGFPLDDNYALSK